MTRELAIAAALCALVSSSRANAADAPSAERWRLMAETVTTAPLDVGIRVTAEAPPNLAAAYLDDLYTSYVYIPTVTVGIGYRVF